MKKLVIAAALAFGVAGLMLAHTVKAQDATDNSAMNADTGNADAAMNADAMNADNAAANTAAQ